MTPNKAWATIAAIVVAGYLLTAITVQPAFTRWRECAGLKATATLGYAGSGVVRLVTGRGADSLIATARSAERNVALRCN